MDKDKGNGKRIIGNIIFWLAVGILIIVVICNICIDSADFFKTNVTSVLSIGAVLFISYYLTQLRNDERKKIDNIERLILKIQKELTNNELISGNNQMCLLYQKSISNKIEYLKSLRMKEISNDLKYINDQFETFRNIYGDHMNDKDFPESMQKDFQRIIVNINDKCDIMLIELRR